MAVRGGGRNGDGRNGEGGRAFPEKGIATRVDWPRQFTVLAQCTRVAILFSGEGPLGCGREGGLGGKEDGGGASKQQKQASNMSKPTLKLRKRFSEDKHTLRTHRLRDCCT